MAGRVRPISVVIRGIEKLSGPIGSANRKIESMLRPIKKVGQALGQLGRELNLPAVGAGLRNLGGSLVDLAKRAALGGGIFGAGLIGGIQKFISYGDEIDATSKRLGVGAVALQEIRHAGEQLDIEQGDLETGLMRLNRALGDAARQPKSPLAQLFRSLGVDASKTKDPLDAAEKLADAMHGKSIRTQTSQLARLVGRNPGGFINLFSGGSKKIRELREETHKFGGVLTADMASSASDADNELKNLMSEIRGIAIDIGVDLLPEVRRMIREMNDWVKANREWLRTEFTKRLKQLMRGIEQTVPKVLALVDACGGLQGVLLVLGGVQISQVIGALGQLTLALGGTAMAILPVTFAFVALGLAIYQVWKNWDQLQQAWADPGAAMQPILDVYRRSQGMETSDEATLRRTQEETVKRQRRMFASARDFVGPKQIVGGQIDVNVSAQKGAAASVSNVQSSGGIDLNVAQSLVPGS